MYSLCLEEGRKEGKRGGGGEERRGGGGEERRGGRGRREEEERGGGGGGRGGRSTFSLNEFLDETLLPVKLLSVVFVVTM